MQKVGRFFKSETTSKVRTSTLDLLRFCSHSTGIPVTWYEQLQECLQAADSRIGSTWAQLATVRGASSGVLRGRPANRSVEVRSVNGTAASFASDLRSGKVDDITTGNNDYGELCWYFPEHRIQFRLSGRLQIDDAVRVEQWNELPPEQRAWWALPAPGSTLNGTEVDKSIVNGEIPPYFCVIKLQIDFVDLLDQKPRPMRREIHTKDEATDKWSLQVVYP